MTEPNAREAFSGPHIVFCECGHDQTTHRRDRCWIGWDGNPVTRRASLIACPCNGWFLPSELVRVTS